MTEAQARAMKAYDDLQRALLVRAASQPTGPIPLSAQELATLLNGMYVRALREPRYTQFADDGTGLNIDSQFGGFDTILRAELSSRQFEFGGDLYWGGHINYVGVGMLAQHYGSDMYQSIRALVTAHNLRQFAGRDTRQFKDIGPGIRWALIGADFYHSKSRSEGP